MRANPLSQLWQMAVDSALNLEISHCFCFPPVFAQISQQKAAPCRCLLLLNLIFFQREWQFAPWCAFTMFWLLLTAVVAQRASWPECLAGETVLSQQWMSRRLPHHEDPPSGDHDEDGAKILSKRLFLKKQKPWKTYLTLAASSVGVSNASTGCQFWTMAAVVFRSRRRIRGTQPYQVSASYQLRGSTHKSEFILYYSKVWNLSSLEDVVG